MDMNTTFWCKSQPGRCVRRPGSLKIQKTEPAARSGGSQSCGEEEPKLSMETAKTLKLGLYLKRLIDRNENRLFSLDRATLPFVVSSLMATKSRAWSINLSSLLLRRSYNNFQK